jgi:hypothetical protein
MGYFKRINEQSDIHDSQLRHIQSDHELAIKFEQYLNSFNHQINNNNMSIIAQQTNNGGGQTVPAGTHVARCYQIIHIGTVPDTFQGKDRLVDKVRLVFELPLETADFGKGEQPFSIGRDFTLSMHEKSALRAFVQNWLGEALSDSDAAKFNVGTMIGKEAMVSVMHRTANTGRVYADLKGASPLVKGMTCPPQVNASFVLDFDSEDFDLRFKMLPEWLQNKVSSSQQFSDRLDKAADQMNNAKKMLEQSGLVQPTTSTDDTDDMPF